MNNTSDLRQLPRFSVDWPIEYKELLDDGYEEWYQTEIVDINKGGVRFVPHSMLTVGNSYLFRIQIPEVEQRVMLTGRVMWQLSLEGNIKTGAKWADSQGNQAKEWIREAAEVE